MIELSSECKNNDAVLTVGGSFHIPSVTSGSDRA